jgi:hypothetical protein
MRYLAAALLLGLGACSSAEVTSGQGERPTCERRALPAFPVGVNIVDVAEDWLPEAEQGARGYGSDKARAQLDRAKALGLDLVVLPVTVWTASEEDTRVSPGPLTTRRGLERLARMIDDAHARELAVLIVPHLQMRDGGWRGALELESAGALLADYARALGPVIDLAESRCAAAYSVGVEFKSVTTSPRGDRAFAALVDGARARFKGALVYSANWDELERARGLERLDIVGVNAFTPLSSDVSASDEDLARGARAAHEGFARVAAKTGKPVWLTELGFRANPASWVRPWEWPDAVQGAPVDERAQARAYQAHARALREVAGASAVAFWLLPSDPDDLANPARYEGRGGFSFVGKPAESVVRSLAADRPRRQ